jgi:hypothetical protein
MKKLISIAIAAAFAATSFGALAQDKKDVKSAQGGGVTTPGKDAVTTGGGKPKKDATGAPMAKPKHQGKRKTEAQRTDKK